MTNRATNRAVFLTILLLLGAGAMAAAATVAPAAAGDACRVAFSRFDFEARNGLIYRIEDPAHPVAVSNNIGKEGGLCGKVDYAGPDGLTTVIGQFSMCQPQCFGNDGSRLEALPPGHYSFVEYGGSFDGCMGAVPGPGVSYQSCKDSGDFVSESLFVISSGSEADETAGTSTLSVL